MFNLGGLGGPFFPGADMRPFNAQYRCYSIAMWQTHVSEQKQKEMEGGGKVVLPQSALDWLTRLHINYPMLFKITNPSPQSQRVTHAGVVEFHQEEGKCFMPYWMMRNLLLNEGDIVQVEYANLPVATYVKFQPQSVEFLDITDPRAVLELTLRNFSCLTKSDVIAISYNNKIYELLVKDLKPANAVTIIECDMNVDFDAPVGYKEPEKVFRKAEEPKPMEVEEQATPSSFVAFSGKGQRIDGKEKTSAEASKPSASRPVQRGVPNYDYKPCKLTFTRTISSKPSTNEQESSTPFVPFSGAGQKLKNRK